MARFGFVLLIISFCSCAGQVYYSDSQRFDISDRWDRLLITDAAGGKEQYKLVIHIPDISGGEDFIGYIYSSVDGSDKAVTI
ncbi:MAG: hypothetical protein RR742_24320, partial [Citrobacter sp.]